MFSSHPGSSEGAVLSESPGKGLWAGGQMCRSLPSSGIHYWKRLLTFILWGMQTRGCFLPAQRRSEMHHSFPQATDVSVRGKGWTSTKPSASRPGDALPSHHPTKSPAAWPNPPGRWGSSSLSWLSC